ncbi:g3780 [Coccomyxa viridis]|uniref:G3774 protein n=1 Tax=Coccomyxa viridis TaxID=1274662 RepID=A0ABP1FNM1_9CHLO
MADPRTLAKAKRDRVSDTGQVLPTTESNQKTEVDVTQELAAPGHLPQTHRTPPVASKEPPEIVIDMSKAGLIDTATLGAEADERPLTKADWVSMRRLMQSIKRPSGYIIKPTTRGWVVVAGMVAGTIGVTLAVVLPLALADHLSPAVVSAAGIPVFFGLLAFFLAILAIAVVCPSLGLPLGLARQVVM